MKIALCLIVKDDSEVKPLNRCLDSIQNYVDGVYLTVTRPNQKKIARLAKKRNLVLSEFKWNYDAKEAWKNWNFSEARNFNWSQVPKGYDWMFWLDSDDIFVGGELLRDIAQTSLISGKDEVFFSYWYGCTFKNNSPCLENLITVDFEHMRERLIKPGKTVWKGRLHETPVPLGKIDAAYVNYCKETPIAVMHGLTDKQNLDRLERNRIILERQLKEEGVDKDPRTLLYLMKIYAELEGKYLDKVLEFGEIYVKKSGWDQERGQAWEIMGNVYGKRGNQVKAIECYMNGIREWPYQPMTYLRLAQAYYNSKRYRDCKFWLNVGMGIDISNKTTSMVNYEAMKVISSELLLKLAYQVDKDTKKALEAARLLQSVHPTPEHEGSVEYLESVNALNDACGYVDKLCGYLDSIGDNDDIPRVLDSLPVAISTQPFAIKLRQANIKPRKWERDEICYFANFGGPHFEKWDGNSLDKGIGGSETAVIRLSEEWARRGWRVAVYGDPEKPFEINGVVYLPWYWFNPKDKFNIFISWRTWGLARKIKCKKFLVDMHDVFSQVDIEKKFLKKIDQIMVKSKYHRNLALNIPDSKFSIISNGV